MEFPATQTIFISKSDLSKEHLSGMNRSSNAKSSSSGRTKQFERASRSLAKPLTALAVLVVVAVAVAMFLVKRGGPENSPVVASSVLPDKPVITPEGWSKGNLSAKT